MKKLPVIYWAPCTTKVGTFHIAVTDKAVVKIRLPFPNSDLTNFFVELQKIGQLEEKKTPIIDQACRELTEYLAGKRKTFDIPLDMRGTEFQLKVWEALLSIPYGQRKNYQDIAIKLNNPNATRAVGSANRVNPIPILIPCHRVLGKNGKLIGYAGRDPSMLNLKQHFLDLESSSPSLSKFFST